MADLYEYVHTGDNEPRFNMPYTPAIKITGGRIVYLAGVTAAPAYHSHPHIASECAPSRQHLGGDRLTGTDPRLIRELKAVAVVPD